MSDQRNIGAVSALDANAAADSLVASARRNSEVIVQASPGPLSPTWSGFCGFKLHILAGTLGLEQRILWYTRPLSVSFPSLPLLSHLLL